MLAPYDAVVLAGGRARRLGGRDKASVEVGGRPLLERVLGAVDDAGRVVVAGPERPTSARVTWVREDPPQAGPVAGTAAALGSVTADVVALLAVDLPFLTREAVVALRTALADSGADGALLLDDADRPQLLCGVWRTTALRNALRALPTVVDASVRQVLAPLEVTHVRLDAPGPAPWLDCDTEQDVERARRLAAP